MSESPTRRMVRVIQQDAWIEGHDSGCAMSLHPCAYHPCPYEDPHQPHDAARADAEGERASE